MGACDFAGFAAAGGNALPGAAAFAAATGKRGSSTRNTPGSGAITPWNLNAVR